MYIFVFSYSDTSFVSMEADAIYIYIYVGALRRLFECLDTDRDGTIDPVEMVLYFDTIASI